MAENPPLLMRRALQLAALGSSSVAPNPMVGSVIWHPLEGIIGEGWHQKFGEAHAEVNAICTVKEQHLLKVSTLYVSLEPCNHFGKTPPCVNLIIEKKIPKVVVACGDPNPEVAGRGIEKLKAAGIEVVVGLLEKEAQMLNKKFLVAQIARRPFITLKWAQTADGFIAHPDGSSKWISSPESRMWVHKWRATHQAILVGKNTLLVDDPQLTVRSWSGPNPIRIVIDRQNSVPQNLSVFDNQAETWIFQANTNDRIRGSKCIQLQNPNNPLPEILNFLWQSGIHSLFVEGGSALLQQFIDQGLWDEALIFSSPQIWEKGLKGPILLTPDPAETVRPGIDSLTRKVNPTSPISGRFAGNS